jgi:putative SOS response-associated peptidase YedK
VFTDSQRGRNAAPTQGVATVLVEDGKWQLEMLHRGPIPSWADDPSVDNTMINACGETVAQIPSFRKAFRNHRCLVLADGFYEWQKTANGKQPYYIVMADDSPFLLRVYGRAGRTVLRSARPPSLPRMPATSLPRYTIGCG